MKTYPAHIKIEHRLGEEIETVQTVEEHCRTTAKYAAQILADLHLEKSAYFAGLIHDSCKFRRTFAEYLLKAVHNEKVSRGSVNHTFAGVRYLLEHYHNGKTEYQNVTCEILAFAAGAHHGLFDCFDENRKNGFEYRMGKENIDYEEVTGEFFRCCANQQELDRLFAEAEQEMAIMIQRILDMTDEEHDECDQETAFYAGLLVRLLLSSVIEGDRRDTSEFMTGTVFQNTRSKKERIQMWNDCLNHVEARLKNFTGNTDIDYARGVISHRCREFAEEKGGIYRLNVPTGGGKTLSSLRFALAHAAKWGKQRLIFTSPLLSILEQNAEVIRQFIQDDELILEHHSNLIEPDKAQDELDEKELLMETWDAPIIITTMVQLLNTMFSGKTSSIRRFHSLCDSVIVIDEVQTVPNKLLSLFSLTVNFLTEICDATIVLCSATQPCMEIIKHPLHEPIRDMVPFDPEIWKIFQRTRIEDAGSKSLEEIADFAMEVLEEANSLLIVCNKKGEAEQLFYQLEDTDAEVYQLSAAMCTAHRRTVLNQIKKSLDKRDGSKILCISTQVIEAGVDISFQRVIRLTAGMDSVVQAAGRCNRNAEAGKGIIAPVYLVSCKGENLAQLPDIQAGKDATIALLNEFKRNPEKYRNDLSSNESISFYYKKLYRETGDKCRDYTLSYRGSLLSLFDLLSVNERFADGNAPHVDEYEIRQSFKLAGSLFEVFEQSTTEVIVPYEKGERIIADLYSEHARKDALFVKKMLEEAKPYTVSLYQYQVEALKKAKALYYHQCGAVSLTGHYNKNTGFVMQESQLGFMEV